MLSLNRNTRLFFFQYIFQRDYSTDFELDEFIAKNIKKRPFNKKKLKSLYDSFEINNQIIKNLLAPEIIKKTNKISIFLIYAFFDGFTIFHGIKFPPSQDIEQVDFILLELVFEFNYILSDCSNSLAN